jgi:hypothetical protein
MQQQAVSRKNRLRFLPLSKDKAMVFLGILHAASLAAITIIPVIGLAYSVGGVVNYHMPMWVMPVIIANGLIAMAATAPLSGVKPGREWGSLWLLWLFAAYVVASILLRNGSTAILAQKTSLLPPSLQIFTAIEPSNRDIALSLCCMVVVGLITGSLKWNSFAFVGWRTWSALLLLIVATRWNIGLINAPCYGLIWMGCYVAYRALGHSWLSKAIAAAACASVIRSSAILHVCFSVFAATVRYHPRNLLDLFGFVRNFTYWPMVLRADTHPNPSNMWVLSLLPIALIPPIIFRHAGSPASRTLSRLLLIPPLMLAIAVLVSGRRGGYLAMFLMMPIGYCLAEFARRPKLSAKLAAVPMLLALFVIMGLHSQKGIVQYDGSAGDRAMLAAASLNMYHKHPLVGIGFGWWKRDFIALTNPVNPHQWNFPHNDYLSILSEGGIIGLLLALGAGIQLIFVICRRLAKEPSWFMSLLLIAMGMQIIALALSHAFLLGVFLWPEWLFPTNAILAASLGALQTKHRAIEDEQPSVPIRVPVPG